MELVQHNNIFELLLPNLCNAEPTTISVPVSFSFPSYVRTKESERLLKICDSPNFLISSFSNKAVPLGECDRF